MLQKRTTSHQLKKHTVDYLEHTTHSFAYTRQALADLYAQTVSEVQRLGGNEMLEAILKKLDIPQAPNSNAST